MPIPGHMREWLEGQLNYFLSQIQSRVDKRERYLREIRSRARKIREINRQVKEFKRLKGGIEEMITQQNWEV